MGAIAKLTSKGQLTVPKEVRERLKIMPGDRVEFVEQNGKTFLFARRLRATDLAGILGKEPGGVTLSTEQMDEAIGEAVAADDERIQREWREGRE